MVCKHPQHSGCMIVHACYKTLVIGHKKYETHNHKWISYSTSGAHKHHQMSQRSVRLTCRDGPIPVSVSVSVPIPAIIGSIGIGNLT